VCRHVGKGIGRCHRGSEAYVAVCVDTNRNRMKNTRIGVNFIYGTHWCTDICQWQAAADIERCCTSCQWNAQVQSWTVAELCYMPTCTGSMWQIEFGTSSPSQSTSVSTTRRQSTWQSVVSLSRISLVVSDCAQHTVASWMYRAIDKQHSAVGRSLSLDQPSGIRFQTSLEKRLKTLFRLSLKTSLFRQYQCAQCIRGFYDNALYKSTFYLLTHLLTMCPRLLSGGG